MTSVGLHRELRFEEAIRAPGRKIEPPYRPLTEFQRHPKLMAFNFKAPLDEVREHELRAMLHRRRVEDIREVAARDWGSCRPGPRCPAADATGHLGNV